MPSAFARSDFELHAEIRFASLPWGHHGSDCAELAGAEPPKVEIGKLVAQSTSGADSQAIEQIEQLELRIEELRRSNVAESSCWLGGRVPSSGRHCLFASCSVC
jgi:hypothetical protein